MQLLYQIGLIGQRDLPFAPNLRTGFEMILLRMLAFTPFADSSEDSASAEKKSPELAQPVEKAPAPASASEPEQKTPAISQLLESINGDKTPEVSPPASAPNHLDDTSDLIDFGAPSDAKPDPTQPPHQAPEPKRDAAPAAEAKKPAAEAKKPAAEAKKPAAEAKKPAAEAKKPAAEAKKPAAEAKKPAAEAKKPLAKVRKPAAELEKPSEAKAHSAEPKRQDSPISDSSFMTSSDRPVAAPVRTGESLELNDQNWVDILGDLQLSGVTYSVASNCAMTASSPDGCTLVLNESHASLSSKNHEARIAKALSEYFGKDIRLTFELGAATTATPAEIEADRREQARLAAVKIIEHDTNVQKLIDCFDGTLITESIEARQQNGT